MKTVWKYPFPIEDRFELEIPECARILTVDVQHGQPCVWIQVATDRKKETRLFRIFGTGHPIDDDKAEGYAFEYVGTFQILGGDFVGHLYEDKLMPF